MNKQVEVPEGVETFEMVRVGAGVGMHPVGRMGGYIQVSDLPVIYKHFSDRLLSDEIRQVAAKRLRLTDEAVGIAGLPQPSFEENAGAVLAAVAAALQATSTPEDSGQ